MTAAVVDEKPADTRYDRVAELEAKVALLERRVQAALEQIWRLQERR